MAKTTMTDSPEHLAILLSAKPHKEPDGDEGMPDDKLPAGLEDGAQDLIDALHGGDKTAVAKALMDCYSLCNGEGQDEEQPEDAGEESQAPAEG